ncbi:hypothetical protein Vretimale_17583 [Volvox reticuliferus]|uniref:Uncharacterized protein n=1 Tax=Volvox reticuliferus TaxID=1737510 RepID=A0A8J4GVB7_9CHLO|nr:hypothetical protein Vretifemale_3548 [Volvox reticuliferus]GIM14774.1 hypothetical protein Vretimale_17583 [Volvox reticuliferus]
MLSATSSGCGLASIRNISGRRTPFIATRSYVKATPVPSHSCQELLTLGVSEQYGIRRRSRGSATPGSPLRAAESDPLSTADDPETAREAIELGNKFAQAGRWQEALSVYEKALTLPGTGLKRYRDKPRLISDGERSAALFNIACCQAQLGDMRSGLVALAGCLELGYDDFAQLRSDPDLDPLRKDERFEGLLKRFERPTGSLANFMSGLFGGKK